MSAQSLTCTERAPQLGAAQVAGAAQVSSAVVAPSTDARALRTALGSYPTGVTIITTLSADGRRVGLTVNSFASLSLDPPLVLWSLSNRSPNLAVFRAVSHFTIHVLKSDQQALALRFANPGIADKFEGVTLRPQDPANNPWGLPMIEGVAACFVCSSRDAIHAGDHTLFTGQVVAHQDAKSAPLVFHRGAFITLPGEQAAAG